VAANHGNGNRIRKLALDAVPLADPDLRAEMKINYVPDLRPLTDGSYMHRCWHMLRDQSVQWPWYDGGADAVRTITPDLDPNALYMRLVDTLKQWDHAGDAIGAALEIDVSSVLGKINAPTLVLETEGDVRYRQAGDAAKALSTGTTAARPFDTVERAGVILSFLEG
jgi:hypothetical protein